MGISVTGGYVYRGSHQPWQGKYIFGDWSKGFDAMDGQLFVATKGADGKWTMEKARCRRHGQRCPTCWRLPRTKRATFMP